MGIVAKTIARVFSHLSDEIAKERRLSLEGGDTGNWRKLYGSRESAAGKTVTIETALTLPAFWACVRATAQAVASMPLPIYDKSNDSRDPADHPLAEIIQDRPNQDQTANEYWEAVVAWMLTSGNAVSEKTIYGTQVRNLELLPGGYPYRTTDGTLVYRYVDRGKQYELPRDKVFHVKGFGFGGDGGLSILKYGVNTFGTAMAMDETAGKLFSNGMITSGVLTTEATQIDENQRAQIEEILERYVGSTKAGKIMVLEAGMDFKNLQLSPVDAELLAQSRASIEDICRWFGMPPVIIGHTMDGQTMWGSGVEQIILSWLTLGLNPILRGIERRIKTQLFNRVDQKRFYAEFTRESLMQMDNETKARYLASMGQNGYMTRAEGRKKLNLPYIPGTEKLTVQSNLVPLDKLGEAGAGGAEQARNILRQWLLTAEPEQKEAKK